MKLRTNERANESTNLHITRKQKDFSVSVLLLPIRTWARFPSQMMDALFSEASIFDTIR